jgi:DNA-binding MarR family transcriptional regulator
MGVTRADLFSEQHNALAELAKALAHPARIAIIDHLIRVNECINGDLVSELGLAQPTISQHLRALKDAGLVQGTIDGVRMCYCIDPKGWERLSTALNQLFNPFPAAVAACCPSAVDGKNQKRP